ncbi:Gustatory receptor 50, partial [Frankliniella occidentalis]
MYLEKEWLWRWGRSVGQAPFSLRRRCGCPPPRVGRRCRCGAAAALLPSRRWEAYSLALVLISVPSTFVALFYLRQKAEEMNPSPSTSTKTDKMAERSDMLVVMLSGNVAVLQALLTRRHFHVFVEEVTTVDRLVRARTPFVPLWLLMWLSSVVMLSVLDLISVYDAGGGLHAASHVPNHVNYLLVYTMEVLFAEDSYSICSRFRTLNARLESACLVAAARYPLELRPGMAPVRQPSRQRDPWSDKWSVWARTTSNSDLPLVPSVSGALELDGIPIHHLQDAYALLCSSVHNVTRRYGPVLVIDVLNLLLHFVTTSYFFLSVLMYDARLQKQMEQQHQHRREVYVTMQGLWIFAHLSRLGLLVHPCSKVKEEANKTGALVGTFLNKLNPSCHFRRQ